jgi:hypothetical protein
MSKGKFLQFPLCALAMKDTPKNIADHILSYGMVSAGRSVLGKLDADERLEKCDEFGLGKKFKDSLELAAHLGTGPCNMTIGSVAGTLRRYHALVAHEAQWVAKYGKVPSARLATTTVFELRDGGQISWREFRVLVGLYSVIGAKTFPVVIPLIMIEPRHCGFTNQATMEAAKKAGDCPEPLTMKQLRGTVQKLWELKWFARVTPDPHGRATYYSNRMTDDEMRERIFTRRTYKAKFVAEQQAKNQGLADRIKAAKGTFNSKPEKGTFNSDSADAQSDENNGHREGTDKAPQGQQEGNGKGTVRAPIIETPSIETLSTETPLSRNTENRNPPKDLAPVGAGEFVFEEKKPLDSFFTEPTTAHWTAFLKATMPHMVSSDGAPTAAWKHCNSIHSECNAWIEDNAWLL